MDFPEPVSPERTRTLFSWRAVRIFLDWLHIGRFLRDSSNLIFLTARAVVLGLCSNFRFLGLVASMMVGVDGLLVMLMFMLVLWLIGCFFSNA